MILQHSKTVVGVSLTSAIVADVERHLGLRLPRDYVDELMVCNGGIPERVFFPTSFPTTWLDDGFEISEVLGIGNEAGIDDALEVGEDWGYPEKCVAFCSTPSGGHDTVLFDYRECGPQGDPGVVYFDCDNDFPGPYRVTESYTEFMSKLQDPPDY